MNDGTSKNGMIVGRRFAWGFLSLWLAWGPAMASTSEFRGVNWADPRDNFQPGVVYLSGLSSTDTYASASIVADRVIGQFVSKLGTNSVRLPINDATVSGNWSAYTGVIDMALTKGRVILCYWGPGHSKAPADMTKWWSMWTTVVAKYGANPNFYVEVFNEPDMYTKAQLLDLYAQWLAKFPNFPRERIILDGTGLAMNVPDVGSDSRFANCLLAVHEYTMFGPATWTAESQWTSHFKGEVGNYAARTVATEWGGPMSTGSKNGVTYPPMNYNVAGTNFFEAYIRSITSQLLAWKMGSFYWAGLKDGDWYSMTTKSGTGSGIVLTVSNQSGLDRMRASWADTTAALVGPSPEGRSVPQARLIRRGGFADLELVASRTGATRVRLLDASGKTLSTRSLDARAGETCTFRFDLSGHPSGLYLARIEPDGRTLLAITEKE